MSMLKDNIQHLNRTQRIATLIFTVYLLMWLASYVYMGFARMWSTHIQNERANYLLLLAFLLTLPYMIILLLIAVLNDRDRRFYLRLGLLLTAPMLISMVLGVV